MRSPRKGDGQEHLISALIFDPRFLRHRPPLPVSPGTFQDPAALHYLPNSPSSSSPLFIYSPYTALSFPRIHLGKRKHLHPVFITVVNLNPPPSLRKQQKKRSGN